MFHLLGNNLYDMLMSGKLSPKRFRTGAGGPGTRVGRRKAPNGLSQLASIYCKIDIEGSYLWPQTGVAMPELGPKRPKLIRSSPQLWLRPLIPHRNPRNPTARAATPHELRTFLAECGCLRRICSSGGVAKFGHAQLNWCSILELEYFTSILWT